MGVKIPPTATIELARVEVILPGAIAMSDEPQRNIDVPSGRAAGGRHGQKQGSVPDNVETRVDAEFFACLTARGGEWMLGGIQVPAHREMKTGLAMLTEVDATLDRVDQDYIGDQMRGRRRGRNTTVNVGGSGEPVDDLSYVVLFEIVERGHRGNQFSDGSGGMIHGARG